MGQYHISGPPGVQNIERIGYFHIYLFPYHQPLDLIPVLPGAEMGGDKFQVRAGFDHPEYFFWIGYSHPVEGQVKTSMHQYDQSLRGDFFIGWKESFFVYAEVLVIGMKLDSLESPFLYPRYL